MIGILLIGFNRPDLIADRLDELEKYSPPNIQIRLSIDGARHENRNDELGQSKIVERVNEFSNKFGDRFKYTVQPSNLGCDAHIYHAISESLKEFEAVICIEDDIELASQTLSSLIDMYLIRKPKIICAMSAFKSNGAHSQKILRNYWRRGKYFSAWGYLVSADFWKEFELITDSVSINKKLETSVYWEQLPKYKRTTWLGRFERGNIDYQIQLEAFSKNIEIALPIYRIIENVGLGDLRATHTYHKRPRNMFGLGPSTIFPKKDTEIRSSLLNRIFTVVDSNTWAGDGFFTVRGRRIGLRTFLRKLFKSKKIHGGNQNEV